MEIIIKATDKITLIDGVWVRLWEGTTAAGVNCEVFVHRIAVANSQDQSQFDQELREELPIDLRHIL